MKMMTGTMRAPQTDPLLPADGAGMMSKTGKNLDFQVKDIQLHKGDTIDERNEDLSEDSGQDNMYKDYIKRNSAAYHLAKSNNEANNLKIGL